MSATFIERVIAVGDYAEDGGAIDPVLVSTLLELYGAGAIGATYVKDTLSFNGTALTSAQRAQVDDILSTMPAVLLTIINALARARWAATVAGVMMLGRMQVPEYDTGAKCATALGV